MPFVKLDTGILDSSLWMERNAREVFITSLLMAEPYELEHPAPELATDSLEETGFVVPPGWYGLVRAAGSGIVRRSCVGLKDGMEALRSLAAPDAESRSSEFGGRRLVRISGGFIVLNYMKYRDHDYTAADRSKRYRDRKKNNNLDEPLRRDARDDRRNVTHSRVQKQSTEAEEKTKMARKRATLLPVDFGISDRVREWAAKKGHSNLDERLDYFIGVARAKGYTYQDWDQALMNSIRDDWAKLNGRSGFAPTSKTGELGRDEID